ncbi:MAG: adenylate/guanylate cyclase domain-containing protein [Anaerolineales bacterium]|jgi:class 3 adenylate cyclase
MDLQSVFDRTPRILVVDDDWLNRDLLATYLTTSGCEVVSAADGEAALEAIQGQPPDLAVVDLQMPRMDGLALCRALKNAPETRFVPVIIVTALDSEDDELKAIEAGADDFITKPFRSIILLTRVRSLLRIKKLHDEIGKRNRLLRQTLNRYMAEDLTEVILTDPERYLKLGGEIRAVTVLFADIRGFTKFTEDHTGPQVISTLNSIFTELSQVVFSHQGTFDKYLGDGLMAFYGAPVPGEDDAQRALNTALEMQRVFHAVCEAADDDLSSLALGVGLHSGEAVVGNIGSEKMMDYTVVGDVVNVSKRLQELAEPWQILLSEATYGLLDGVEAEKVGPVNVPGRREKIVAYAIDCGDN